MKVVALSLLLASTALAGNIQSLTETRDALQTRLNPADPLFLEIAAALFHRSPPETLVFATNAREAAENLNALINIENDVPPRGTDSVTVYFYQED